MVGGCTILIYRKAHLLILLFLVFAEVVAFDFVGSLSDGYGFDADHEGHPGWKADEVLANVDTWLAESSPDIVLLHIGTNDVSALQPNSQTIAEIEGILDKIYNYNPQIMILFCKLIPRRVTWENEYIYNEQLNVLIEDLFYEKKNQGYDIYLVDQFAAFNANSNWADDYMIDNVHPNDVGYHVMAETYFQVLQPLLSEQKYQIAGLIQYYSNHNPISNVTIDLSGDQIDQKVSGYSGIFAFDELQAGGDFFVIPDKSKLSRFDNNTITIFSAALTLRHAVGVDTLNPWQQLAADVDESGTITAFDAALIARYSVELDGLEQDYVGEWRFVPDSLTYENLDADHLDANFTGILLGDVAGDWSSSGLFRTANSQNVSIGEIKYLSDNRFSLPIIVNADSLLSFAGEVEFSKQNLRFRRAEFFEKNNWLVNSRSGKVKLGFYSAKALAVSDTVGSLEFEIISNEYLLADEIRLKSQINQSRIQLQRISLNSLPGNFTPLLTVGDNYPNPFNPTTVLPIDVKVAGTLYVKVFNTLGQEVKEIYSQSVTPGQYKLRWDGTDTFGVDVADGVYICRFQLNGFIQNKLLVKLK
ncbi:hypothetical protein B6D60_11895 [candidate division KSB1 bacterium 4484_87]|nr:MAG: hypothetical protein B6D60_11895 [candidate division KSB1 bacterium 4484_87]